LIIHPVDFEPNDSWLDGPLPYVSPGWAGLERIMPALVSQFCISRVNALEFGVEYGYSTCVLAQLFDHVTGVDTFTGDIHSGVRDNYSQVARENLAKHKNVTLVQESFDDWIRHDSHCYDLIHIDIVHTYWATFECGRWSVEQAPVVIFHDSESFPEVKQAAGDIAMAAGMTFYNYPLCNGLGVLVR
jgi:hypothetical protein